MRTSNDKGFLVAETPCFWHFGSEYRVVVAKLRALVSAALAAIQNGTAKLIKQAEWKHILKYMKKSREVAEANEKIAAEFLNARLCSLKYVAAIITVCLPKTYPMGCKVYKCSEGALVLIVALQSKIRKISLSVTGQGPWLVFLPQGNGSLLGIPVCILRDNRIFEFQNAAVYASNLPDSGKVSVSTNLMTYSTFDEHPYPREPPPIPLQKLYQDFHVSVGEDLSIRGKFPLKALETVESVPRTGSLEGLLLQNVVRAASTNEITT
ncbi:hypothetical protein B0H14DRAFT_2624754 [Mycena olivaceomarginata]|nr:hypothetical protein B0H14DRAFT_2625304 [Mycena olivaceomarginata]KAJ7791732.1 hypothetical protein B0H14DRAFT_2624754 [Mycena olivaceomarginata]